MRMMRSSGRPATFFQIAAASSSSAIDGDQQAVLRQAVVLGHQVPGVGDGEVLEIVAEAEIPQHLEEGMVAGGVADVIEVVVLAAGADAFLRGGGADVGPLLLPGEDILELHHAGVGEHQRRVVARHQRRAGHRRVAVAGEVVQEGGADVVAAGHGRQMCPGMSRKRGLHVAHGRLSVTGGGADVRQTAFGNGPADNFGGAVEAVRAR